MLTPASKPEQLMVRLILSSITMLLLVSCKGSKLTGANDGPSQSEQRPTEPFSRDADFVERGTILDQIHQKCAVSGSRTALIGLGDVG